MTAVCRVRLLALAVASALSVGLGWYATRVKAKFSLDDLLPQRAAATRDFHRYREIFPKDERRVFVFVESPDLWSPAGLRQLAALEADLRRLEHVDDVTGPMSIQDVTASGDDAIAVDNLFPQAELTAAEVDRVRRRATRDPLFRWRLTPPDGRSVTIEVRLDRRAIRDRSTRCAFIASLDELLARHRTATRKVLASGLPVIGTEYERLIRRDEQLLVPAAFCLIAGLLLWAFGSVREVAASLLTIVASVLWTRGAMGLLGVADQMLTSTTPVIVMIISVSDTVHIVAHYRRGLTEGLGCEGALSASLAESAWPCFLTELVIAAGFLSLACIDVRMTAQFGVITACGMILTWIANVTVLPLAIHLLRPRRPGPVRARPTGPERWLARLIELIARQVTRRPGRVGAVALALLAASIYLGAKVDTNCYVHDLLRPTSRLRRDIDYAERALGGSTELVVLVEATGGAPASEPLLQPEVFRLLGRLEQRLETAFPGEIQNAVSAAGYVKKVHRVLAGPEAAAGAPLPATRSLLTQEVELLDDGSVLRDHLSFGRRAAAVTALVPDVGAHRVGEILREVRSAVRAEELAMAERGVPVALTLTGRLAIQGAVYDSQVRGLPASLALTVLLSFAVFAGALRSLRLGLLALVPNLLPLVLILGFMGLVGISLGPTTAIVFSVTLVIADDDTVQYFVRFRRRFDREPTDPHAVAALSTLREVGAPMLLTSCAISAGFLLFVASSFLGLAFFGLLVGASLIAAAFADLFLTPVLLMALKPGAPRRAPRTAATASGRSSGAYAQQAQRRGDAN